MPKKCCDLLLETFFLAWAIYVDATGNRDPNNGYIGMMIQPRDQQFSIFEKNEKNKPLEHRKQTVEELRTTM